jgi:hypothetical protein
MTKVRHSGISARIVLRRERPEAPGRWTSVSRTSGRNRGERVSASSAVAQEATS